MGSRLTLVLLLLMGCVGARGQDAVWTTPWYTTAQPGFSWDDISVVGTNTGQFVYVGDIYGWSDQVTSMTPGGVVNWQVNVPEFAVSSSALAAGADGSVYWGTTKIDAAGHVVWYRNDLGVRASTLTSDAFYVANCYGLASLDIDTGATHWSVDRGPATHCISSIGSDVAGNVYLLTQFSGPPYSPTPPIQFAKYDPAGSLKWDLSITTMQIAASFIGAADGRVFINQGPDVAAYDAASGALLWTHPQTNGRFMAGSPASPFSVDNLGTHKLDAADGHVDWTQQYVSFNGNPAVEGDDMYVCLSSWVVAKFAVSTGDLEWAYGLSDGGPCSQVVLNAGNVLVPTTDPASGSLRIDALNAANGTLVSQAPAAVTQQAVTIWDSFVDQGRIVQVGQVGNARRNEHLRSVDATTGAVDWDVAFDSHSAGFGPLLGHSADSILVTASSGVGGYYLGSFYWIGSFARSDGSLRWSLLYAEYGQSYMWGSAPLIDSHGDVVVSYAGGGGCQFNPNSNCYTSTVMKLSAIDGTVLWHFDALSDVYTAPPITLIGDDVLVTGGLSDPIAGKTIARLSGSDGSVMWSTATFDDSVPPFDLDGSANVSVNPDGTILLTDSTERALLQSSGEVVWTDRPTIPCLPNCAVDDHVQLADGTILLVGAATDPNNGSISGWVGAQPLVQNASVRQAPVDADAPPDVKVVPLQLATGNGGVWIASYLRQPPYTHFYFLARLDPATLAVSDQQVLATDNAEAFAPGFGFSMIGAPNGDRLFADTYNFGNGAPATTGAAVFDTTINAHGDLALSLSSADQPAVSTFQATVTYTGDSPLTHARLTLWHQGFNDAGTLTCATASASNCTAESRSGYVETTFDIQPGGSITVSGTYPASKELSTLYGSVNGPPSLAEPSLGNNFRSAPLGELLFKNGFE